MISKIFITMNMRHIQSVMWQVGLMGEKEIRPLLQFYIELPEQYSNGEAAMSYCENIFEPDTMYLLDEPDNGEILF